MINKRMKSIIGVSLSNIFTIIVNVAISFLIPIFLTKYDYSQFKIFTFYGMYFPILHFGFIDAILILYAGKTLKDLEQTDLSGKIKTFGILQIGLFILSIVISIFFVSNLNIIIPIILFIFLQNANLLFDTLYRTTKKFSYYTRIKFLNRSILFLLILITVFNSNFQDLSYYIFAYIGVQLLLLIYNLFLSRRLLFSKNNSDTIGTNFIGFFKIGYPIVGAYILNLFIVGLARIFVENYYTKYDYAVYSFSFSIVSLVISVIISFSAVIYPLLFDFSEESRYKIFTLMGTIINIIYSFIVFLAPLIGLVILYVIPSYSDSVIYILLMLPLILYNVQYVIKILNYFYFKKKQKLLIVINGIILMIAISLFFLAIQLNLKLEYFSVISSFTLLLLVIGCEVILKKIYNFSTFKSIVFYIFSFVFSIIYLVPNGEYFGLLFFLLTITIYFSEIKSFIFNLKERKNENSND